jgi:hypothetical protein
LEAIEADSVMNELLGLGSYDKKSSIPVLETLKEHHRQVIAVVTAFLLGLTVRCVEANDRKERKDNRLPVG